MGSNQELYYSRIEIYIWETIKSSIAGGYKCIYGKQSRALLLEDRNVYMGSNQELYNQQIRREIK